MRKLAYVPSSPAQRVLYAVRHALSWQKVLIAAALTTVLVVAIAIEGATSPGYDPTLQALEQLPAYALVYPGATPLNHAGTPASNKTGVGATVTRYFGFHSPAPPTIDTTVQAIIAWYATQLQSQGWQTQPLALPQTDLAAAAWTHHCATATLHIYRASAVSQLRPSVDATNYPFVFAFLIQRTCSAT